MAAIPTYKGRFGQAEAERLLWRAGFGPAPGEAEKLSRKGMRRAVLSLTRPKGKAKLHGPAPHDEDGLPLAPFDAYGHDMLWWLDRMVRTNRPFDERMALIWHDWFATADVNSQRLSIGQAELFRRQGRGSFLDLLIAVTRDPAMLIWLSGIDNDKDAPNENYAREMMELFTLGASNEAGYPYSEDDVREQARALTGWTAEYSDDVGLTDFHYDPERHDDGRKRIFGKSGAFDWRDSCKLCVAHRAHRRFFVEKLWSYFIPKRPSRKTRKALERLYVKRRYAIRPVVEAILMHPELYRGPAMVKPPVVYIAGLLRARKQGIGSEDLVWASGMAGQRLFDPPNVSGWNDERWLDTSTFRGRWTAANIILDPDVIDEDAPYDESEGPRLAVRRAIAYWNGPTIGQGTRRALLRYAAAVESVATEDWQQETFRVLRQNALRLLLATSPDMQTS